MVFAAVLLVDSAAVANTQKIAAVILNRQYIRRADLDKMLGRVEAAAHH